MDTSRRADVLGDHRLEGVLTTLKRARDYSSKRRGRQYVREAEYASSSELEQVSGGQPSALLTISFASL